MNQENTDFKAIQFQSFTGAVNQGDATISINDYQDFRDKIEEKESVNKYILKGVLLYTDEDNNLKEYIRQYFQEFHNLSSAWCNILVLEKPDREWRKQNLSLVERFKLRFAREIDKSQAYNIARELKIQINQIPCLVFFGKEINSQRLIIPIKLLSPASFSMYFRELFTIIETLLYNNSNSISALSSSSAFDTISYRFDQIINYLDKNAQEIASQKQYLYQQQIIIAEKLVMEDKSVTNNLQKSQIAGGIVNAQTVTSQQIGGSIQNTEGQKQKD